MSEESLSKIERVALRKVWPNEASDFTPWLADHITDLGEALGIELETQERESPVGSRSLDIMATDSSGRPVIIENQLTCSDGDHLGRLLIYAAGKDADVVIWLPRISRRNTGKCCSGLTSGLAHRPSSSVSPLNCGRSTVPDLPHTFGCRGAQRLAQEQRSTANSEEEIPRIPERDRRTTHTSS